MVSSVPPIEIGSLTAVSPNESQFIGSSSGIFFVNTVQRAFEISKASSPNEAPPPEPDAAASIETYIAGVNNSDDLPDDETRDISHKETQSLQPRTYRLDPPFLGYPSSQELAKELIQVYFQMWHPLFPFLHATFLRELEDLYTDGSTAHQDNPASRRKTCRAITFQCIFNIAALDRPGLKLGPECSIESATVLTAHLCSLASKHDIPILQALLAGQLYLIATMSLHAASTVGGMLLRLILHGGFHRCPCRYSQLSTHDSDLRKRIFWSAYAADRYLSQALGLPLGIQDSDVDVCLPGVDELHRPVSRSHRSATAPATEGVHLHLPEGHPNSAQVRAEERNASSEILRARSVSDASHSRETGPTRVKRPGEEALAHHVTYGRLTGRALEMLHKSILVRTVEYSDVLELTSDIHLFWNALPQQLQELPQKKDRAADKNMQNHNILGIFFTMAYQQLILLVNRPFLSLETSSLEFRLSLQTCIGASRTIISTLNEQIDDNQCVSWPGTLSVTWMSGLILAFACTLDLYPVKKGFPEIQTCLRLLEEMSKKWAAAKHCQSALKLLLNNLSAQFNELPNFLTADQSNKRAYPTSTDYQQDLSQQKRQRTVNMGEEGHAMPNERAVVEVSDQNGSAVDSRHNVTAEAYNNSAFAPWIQHSDMYYAPAYSQDMFGRLSCETLFQDFGFDDFWNRYPG